MKLIDTHIHGGYGINFNKCTEEDFHTFARKMLRRGIVAFCPTLVGDAPLILNSRLGLIKQAMQNQGKDEAKILGVHLEGTFLNPQKSGIQNAGMFLTPTVENFKKIAGDFSKVVKIVTLAPELDKNCTLQDFLEEEGIRAHAGHTLAESCYNVTGTTHHFNAMEPLTHKKTNIALAGLLKNEIFSEIIADGEHVTKDMLRLFFRIKNKNKIILVSDALPIAHSELDTVIFCGKHIYKGGRDKDGTLAGSCRFLDEIATFLLEEDLVCRSAVEKFVFDNVVNHLKLDKKTLEEISSLGDKNSP